MKRRLIRALACLPLLAAAFPVLAQDKWPSKPIELIYPYPPGNETDAVMRLIAQSMSKRLGVPVQVINKPGGGGVVGTTELARAKPDGYTIGSWTPGPGITQVLAGNAQYKQSDLQPLTGIFVNDFVLAGRKDIPGTTLADLANWAKSSGKTVVIGSYAPAAVPALIAAKIARTDGWKYKVVAFPNPSAKELTAGDADLTTTGADMVAPFVRSNEVKVFSTWMPQRAHQYPAVPTIKESGYGEFYSWTGLIAPAGVPPEILQKLVQAAREAVADKPVVDMLSKLGVPTLSWSPEDMAKRIESDSKWMAELMGELGMLKK